ncbi:TrmH family RNA methyltransferase [Paenibacillus senegalensis]|uniref:TrmH family RNA methyltransferase n=1 Tax=Paenibacillus senegalensis TaxID=1465766 RepID=UPI0002895A61|nr:RNA methyltransferase [Paenibacillus senegalensis]
MDQEIVSLQNPRVKQWSQLLTKKGRDSQKKFMLEGNHLLIEALKAGIKLETIIYDRNAGIPEELQPYIPERGLERIAVSREVLAKVADTKTPQPVMAAAHQLQVSSEVVLEDRERPYGMVVVVDGVQDPGNLGTIIRAADAAGAGAVILGQGTVDLYNPKTIRATMGSLFHLPIVQAGPLPALLEKAAARGVQIVSTSLSASQSCYNIDFTVDTWIIVGNEGEGVSSEVSRWANQEVIIPIRGQAESLNVAMAATILLYESLRQRELSNNN